MYFVKEECEFATKVVGQLVISALAVATRNMYGKTNRLL